MLFKQFNPLLRNGILKRTNIFSFVLLLWRKPDQITDETDISDL